MADLQEHINAIRNATQQLVEASSQLNKLLPALEQRANTAAQHEAEIRNLQNEIGGKRKELTDMAIERADLEKIIKGIRDKLKGLMVA